ncbi:MAG TPA: AraC family ligand binding domain-containing protein [Phycisphaeraceae bacterium]
MSGSSSHRVRTPPRVRFAPSEDRFNLKTAAETLAREPSGQRGHKQMALFRHGPATLALYLFETGASLPDHVVDGPVIIHVLQGRLKVATDQTEHDLPAGTLLRLAPNVRHDVSALERSQMLLTICVEGPGSHAVEEP